MAEPATELLTTPTGRIEWARFGTGQPVTLFAHGLGNSIETTRPFASGVRGSRVLLHFRGHGRSDAPQGEWTYAELAQELRAVADHAGCTRALGVSLGAGALCTLLVQTPDRFDRVVLALPAALDQPRAPADLRRSDAIADLLEAGDAAGLAHALAAEQAATPQAREAVAHWAALQARWLLGTRAARAFRELPRVSPVADTVALGRVRVPVLVIAQEGDPVHPVSVARATAAALPGARLTVLPAGGLLWAHRVTLRRYVTEFLDGTQFQDAEGDST